MSDIRAEVKAAIRNLFSDILKEAANKEDFTLACLFGEDIHITKEFCEGDILWDRGINRFTFHLLGGHLKGVTVDIDTSLYMFDVEVDINLYHEISLLIRRQYGGVTCEVYITTNRKHFQYVYLSHMQVLSDNFKINTFIQFNRLVCLDDLVQFKGKEEYLGMTKLQLNLIDTDIIDKSSNILRQFFKYNNQKRVTLVFTNYDYIKLLSEILTNTKVIEFLTEFRGKFVLQITPTNYDTYRANYNLLEEYNLVDEKICYYYLGILVSYVTLDFRCGNKIDTKNDILVNAHSINYFPWILDKSDLSLVKGYLNRE